MLVVQQSKDVVHGISESLLFFAAKVVRWGSKRSYLLSYLYVTLKEFEVWGPFDDSRFSSRLRIPFESVHAEVWLPSIQCLRHYVVK
jgi:hypothetical protein